MPQAMKSYYTLNKVTCWIPSYIHQGLNPQVDYADTWKLLKLCAGIFHDNWPIFHVLLALKDFEAFIKTYHYGTSFQHEIHCKHEIILFSMHGDIVDIIAVKWL